MRPTPDRLPSRPLRNWFLAWHIHTGDSAEVIAKGFDLDAEVVVDFLRGEAPLMINAGEMIEMCRQIRVAPRALWKLDGSADSNSTFETDEPSSEFGSFLADALWAAHPKASSGRTKPTRNAASDC